MKKAIYFILGALLIAIVSTIFLSGKDHVKAVETVTVLEKSTDSLTSKVDVLYKQAESFSDRVKDLDSIISVKDNVIDAKNRNLNSLLKFNDSLKKETNTLRKMGPIVIHDTIFITEKKNFWGKTKKTVEGTTSVDTLDLEQNILPDSTKN